MDTREYQIKIPYEDYSDRMSAIYLLLEELRKLSGEELDINEFEASIYEEEQISTSNCGHKFSELRRRKLYDEFGEIKEDKTTIDINNDSDPSHDKTTALAWDLSPSDEYSHYEEKIEQGNNIILITRKKILI